jgi:hypothetical protein
MCIYSPIIITEEIEQKFKPTRLAIKELAGHLYFCKSTKLDIENYSGSGVSWKKLIKKYGKKNIKTLWISDWYYTAEEIQKVALHFSEENQIVQSKKWANLKIENGLDGGDCGPIGREKTRKKLTGITPTHVLNRSMTRHNFFHEDGTSEFCTDTDMIQKYKLLGSGLSQLRAGRLFSYRGWRLTSLKRPHGGTDLTKFTFHHTDGRVVSATRNEMVEKYRVNRGNLNSVIRGDRPIVSGWRLQTRE